MLKQILPVLGLTVGVSMGALMGPAAAADQVEINFVSWGGAYTKSQVKGMIEPYQQANPHVKINVIDYTGGLAEIKAQIEAKNVTWQIVDMTPDTAIAGCDEGLFESLDPSKWAPGPNGEPATEDFVEGAISECFVGNIAYTTVMAYNSKKVTGNPSTVADFWDLKKFPGKRSLRNKPDVNMEWGVEAMGVSRDKIYETLSTPEGIDLAFKGLEKIKADVVWWEAGAQPPQLLADGEVAFASAWNGRLYNAIVEEKQPIVIMWDTQVFDLDGFAVPKGAPNLDEVIKFLAFATSTKPLAETTKYISYGPLRKSSMKLVSDKVLPHLPTAPENFKNAIQLDVEWWADRTVELNERFAAWLAK